MAVSMLLYQQINAYGFKHFFFHFRFQSRFLVSNASQFPKRTVFKFRKKFPEKFATTEPGRSQDAKSCEADIVVEVAWGVLH